MSATIKYKGNVIATASNNTKTLLTAGKYMEANVVVTDNGGGGGATLQTKSVSYTPSASQQTDTVTPDAGYDGLDQVNVTVNAVSAGSATTPTTTITANPTITISGNSVSASVSKTQSVTPTVSAGYVSSGTAGTITVSGSDSATIPSASTPYGGIDSIDSSGNVSMSFEIDNGGYIAGGTYAVTQSGGLSVQSAQTIHPSTSDQTIAANKYLTGAQTIKGVTYSGLDASNIKKDVVVKIGDSADDDRIVSVTGTYEGGGGGITPAPENDVQFIDYDGTILYSYSATDFANLSALPANPSHNGLVAQGWNWALSDAKTHVATYGFLDIGQLYNTSDGKTRFHIIVGTVRRDRYIKVKCSVANTLTLDWGDNSATETNANTSENIYSHTYSSSGEYTITMSVSSGTITLGSYVMGGTVSGGRGSAQWSTSSLLDVNIGDNIDIGGSGTSVFNDAICLRTITMPTSVTYLTNKALFSNVSSLVSITLPKPYGSTGVAGFSNSAMLFMSLPKQDVIKASWSSLCSRSLQRICIPVDLSSDNQGINPANAIKRLILAGTALKSQVINDAWTLEGLTIPSSITTINNNAITNTRSLKEVHMLGTTPPTLSGTSIFTSKPSDMVIYVPYSADHSVLNAYQTANNWSTFSSLMQEE